MASLTKGPKGGTYYVTKTGKKVYTKKAPKGEAKAKARKKVAEKKKKKKKKVKPKPEAEPAGDMSDEDFNKHAVEMKTKFTPEEVDSLQVYASGDYEAINKYKRSPETSHLTYGDPTEFGGTVSDEAMNLKRAMNTARFPADTTVYRGVVVSKGGSIPEVGDSFTDRGFSSTSTNPKIASQFASQVGEGETAVTYKVNVKKGQAAIPLGKNYHQPGNPKFDLGEESEVLIDSGAKYRVTGRTKTATGWEMSVDLISTDADAWGLRE